MGKKILKKVIPKPAAGAGKPKPAQNITVPAVINPGYCSIKAT